MVKRVARNPFDDIERTFDEWWRAMVTSDGEGGTNPWGSRTPDVEVIEEGESIVVLADLPEARAEDLRVDVSPLRVVIAGTNKLVATTGLEGAATLKRREGAEAFQHTVPLPTEVLPEGASAQYNNGILEVVLPKRDPAAT